MAHTVIRPIARRGVTSRRAVLGILAGSAMPTALLAGHAVASPDTMAATLQAILGPTKVTAGRVKLEIPELAENGNSVPLTITVDSPMTAADHVKSIYVLSPENPQPDIARFHLTPRAGKAKVSTSVRLATSQRLMVVAVMSDGSAWTTAADVIVTMSACIDTG
jgi:sulfur-oxidizing protein SoxY